jgi:hypothetical protein
MREFFAVFKVWFSSFLLCCTLKSVGPGYANSLRHEASRSYTAKVINLDRMEIEETEITCYSHGSMSQDQTRDSSFNSRFVPSNETSTAIQR